MKKIIGLILLLSFQAHAGYLDKLKDLKQHLDVDFCSLYTEAQRADVTNRLYDFIQSSAHQDVYSYQGLVQRIYIDCGTRSTSPTSQPHLRDHSLLVDYNLNSLQGFEENIPYELGQLQNIKTASLELKAAYPALNLIRRADLLTEVTGTNVDYLQLLNYLQDNFGALLTTTTLNNLENISINDTTDELDHSSAALVNSWYKRDKKDLIVSVVHDEHHNLDTEALNVLIGSVTSGAFDQIGFQTFASLDEATILKNFANFLTPETLNLLKANSVKQVVFVDEPEKERQLFEAGVLKLGPTVEKMNAVVDILFRR